MTRVQQIETYRRMVRIRFFEEEGTRLFREGQIPGAYHASIGEEATIVGACMALRDDDAMTGTHRSHGHPIGKGAHLKPLMAELMGKASGICNGRGGSMHLADRSVGIIGESAIVGGGIPLATGVALSAMVMKKNTVCLCFFGDGAVNQGTFHESLNMAALWKLPAIYVCENNGYAIVTSVDRSHGQTSIAKRADAYGLPGVCVDGQTVEAVFDATNEAVIRARAGRGPTLIEAKTYRFDEHNVGLIIPGAPYRRPEEVDEYRNNQDPIALYRAVLRLAGVAESQLDEVDAGVRSEVDDATQSALSAPYPELATLAENMFAE